MSVRLWECLELGLNPSSVKLRAGLNGGATTAVAIGSAGKG